MREVTWRKSSYSGSSGGSCVELANVRQDVVAVRDSKDPDGPVLLIPRPVLRASLHRPGAVQR